MCVRLESHTHTRAWQIVRIANFFATFILEFELFDSRHRVKFSNNYVELFVSGKYYLALVCSVLHIVPLLHDVVEL